MYIMYIEDPFIRKYMTKFRTSAHMLRIEKGRYKKIERNNIPAPSLLYREHYTDIITGVG